MGFKDRYFELSFKNILLLLFFWLMIGYPLGTVTLIWPVRWVTNYAIEQNWTQSTQDLIVKVIIGILVILSFLFALMATRRFINMERGFRKVFYIFFFIVVSGFCVWLWTNPKLIQSDTRTTSIVGSNNTEFVFGPYPDEYDLQRLKDSNYTAVISLLHEAVVPFEPKLLNDEKENCEEVGIQLINIPMLPWISENESALKKLEDFALNNKGKFYLHCYLGKDRVNLAKRIIETANAEIKIKSQLQARSITDLSKFERGEIIKLDENVYVTPYPTDDEFLGYVLNGSFKNIISLFDPKNPKDTLWTNKEKKLCQTFKIPLQFFPFDEPRPAKKKLESLTKLALESEHPLLIHGYASDSPQVKSFVEYYNSSKEKNLIKTKK